MLGVKHIHFSNHTDNDLRRTLNVGEDAYWILHNGQNDMWAIEDGDSEYSVLLIAHQTKVLPTPEIQIDFFKCVDVINKPSEIQLNELLREFLADKKNKIIYAPKDLQDKDLINALINANFVYDDLFECYVKVPQNR